MLVDPRKLRLGKITPSEVVRFQPNGGCPSHSCIVKLSLDGEYSEKARAFEYAPDEECIWRFVGHSEPDCFTLVLVDPEDDTLLGYATFSPDMRSLGASGGVEITLSNELIFIDARYRGRGYGSMLAAASAAAIDEYIAHVRFGVVDPDLVEFAYYYEAVTPAGAVLSEKIESAFEQSVEKAFGADEPLTTPAF